MHHKSATGFTLIELVIGMVVLSISFTILFATILPAAEQGAAQVNQIKASELAKSMMSEIMGKAYDENSNMIGGDARCGEGLDTDFDDRPNACTLMSEYGAENGEVRNTFNDVDDYHALNASPIPNHNGFNMTIEVIQDSDFDGINDDPTEGLDLDVTITDIAKLVTISITTPTENVIVFSSYKVNF